MPDAPWRAAQAGMRRRKRARELEGLANARRPRCRFSRKLTDWCACVQAPLSGCTQGGDLMNANRTAAMARAAGTVHMSKRYRPAARGPGLCTSASVAVQPHAAQECAHVQVLPPGRTRPKTAHAQAFPPSRAQPKTAHKRKHCRRLRTAQDCAQAQALPSSRARPKTAHAQALPPSRAQPKTAHIGNRCRPAARNPGMRTSASIASGRAQPKTAQKRNRCRLAAHSPRLRKSAIAAA